MGKLAVVFVAALVFQAVLGGIPRRFGYGSQEPRDLINSFDIVSDDVYEPFQKTPSHGFPMTKKYFEQPKGHYNTEEEIKAVTKKLQVTLERVHTENPLMKRAFMHLVRRYFESMKEVLSSEYNHFYKMYYSKHTTYSVQETKQYINSFMKKFVEEIEQVPKTAYLTFIKATSAFEDHLDNFVKVNNPVRQLVIDIQATADYITNWYEAIPYKSNDYEKVFGKYAPQLSKSIYSFISKIEKIESYPEFITNLKKIASALEKEINEHTFVEVIQEVTTEVRKYIISGSISSEAKISIGNELLKVFQSLGTSLGSPEDINYFSNYLMAYTNRLSMYLQNDIHSEDFSMLMNTFEQIFQILESESNTEYKKFTYSLKEVIQKFETEKYFINSFLQKISLEFNQFIWEVYYQQHTLPKKVYKALTLYGEALEEIHSNQRVVKAFVSVQTPAELIMEVQTVTDRLAQLLHIITPGFELTNVDNRVHYFYQILEIVKFRLHEISMSYEKSTPLVKRVYENLNKIQNYLEEVVERDNLDSNVNFGVQLQNVFMEMRDLAFENVVQDDVEFVKLYSDFLFGLEYLLNQHQFDIQILSDQYDVNTLNVQIEYFAHRISNLLHRSQPKPELKHVVLLQVEALKQEIEGVIITLKEMQGHKVFSELVVKYNKIYDELHEISKIGWNKSFESLPAFLNNYIKVIVNDLQRLISFAQETPKFNDIYKYLLITFSNIMARLENVHYYEYYNELVNTEEYVNYVKTLSSHVSSKLQSTFGESDKIKYDLSLRALMFARRLENIALHLQIDAKVFPKKLYSLISELQQFVSTKSVSVNELRNYLDKFASSVYMEIEQIVEQESYVGVKQAFIEYLVALEKLYFNTYHVLVRSHHDETFQEIFTRIDMHVHCLLKAIEQIHPENKIALKVFHAQYERLINFVNVLSKKLYEFTGHSKKLHYIIEQLEHIKSFEPESSDDIDEFGAKLIEGVKHTVVVLRETYWILYEIEDHQQDSDVKEIFKSFFDEFLTTVQRMHFEIRTNVIVYQRSYNLKKWGVTKNYFNKNYKTFNYRDNKYDDEYYGSFAKYFNKFGKKFNYFPVEQREHKTEYTKYSKPEFGYKQVFDNEYEPEHTYSTSFNLRYPEYNNQKYSQHSQYPSSFSKVHGGEYEPEYKFENSFSNKYSKVFNPNYSF